MAHPEMAPAVLIIAIFLVSAFVGGVAGSGFSAFASPVLWIVDPARGVFLIIALSLCNQLLMTAALREQICWFARDKRDGAAVYLAGGVLGAPIGLYMLTHTRPELYCGALGLFLVAYGVANLSGVTSLRAPNLGIAGALGVGAVGGVVGGFSGFPGSAPLIYLSMRGFAKSAIRGVTQPFILGMQMLSIALLIWRRPQFLAGAEAGLFLKCLPLTLLGAALGVLVYRRLSNLDFRRVVFALLIISGAGFLGRALVG